MRDVDRGRAVGALELADLDAHVDPQLRIEIGERLVEHQQRRLDDERPRERDALLLPARERAGQPVGQGRRARRAPASPCARLRALVAQPMPRCFRPKADVVEHREMREQRVVLEDEADVALVGRQPRQVASAERIDPAVGVRKPAIRRKVVVLPQPLAPRSETSSPGLRPRARGLREPWSCRNGRETALMSRGWVTESYFARKVRPSVRSTTAMTATVRNISSTETDATVGSKNCSTWARIWIGRVLIARPGEEERDRHVVERGDEGEDEGRDHPCPHIRQHDGEEGLQRRRCRG